MRFGSKRLRLSLFLCQALVCGGVGYSQQLPGVEGGGAFFFPPLIEPANEPLERIARRPAPKPVEAPAEPNAPTQEESATLSNAELVERLNAAEKRLAELENDATRERLRSVVVPKEGEEKADDQNEAKEKEDKEAKEEKKDDEKKEEKKDEKKDDGGKDKKEDKPKKWYDKINLRGYSQFRFNQELFEEENSAPANYVGDSSVSEDRSFLIRRARLIFSGDVHEHLFLYFQPDFAVSPNGAVDQIHFAQLRDLYGDIYLDTDKVYRFRVGQSKVPYGWENLQSSSNRIVLDRADALNSAARNERDLGVFFYYTPKSAQHFFDQVNEKGLKGSGNYGVFGIGAYNGQGGSLQEQNDNLHFISRLTLPMCFGDGQLYEAGIQGYIGEYMVLGSNIRPLGVGGLTQQPIGTLGNQGGNGWNDRRVAATFVMYPQPFGFQTEWNVGRGPALNAAQTAIEDEALYGGYMMTYLRYQKGISTLFPFFRWSYYNGGYKSERNAPDTLIDDFEVGTEWQIGKGVELTFDYLFANRTNTNPVTLPNEAPYRQFDGDVARLQLQINY